MITNIKFRSDRPHKAAMGLLFLAAILLITATRELPSSAQSQSDGQAASPNQRRGGPPTDKPDVILKGQPRNLELAARQAKAYQEGGLKAAAAVAGFAYQNVPVVFPNGGPNGLDQILTESAIVGTGVVESNASRLTSDGRAVFLEYKVRLVQTFKGQHPNRELTIVIPGGRVSFPDGTWAQVNTPGFLWPLPGREYLWCLRTSNLERYEQLDRKDQNSLLYEPVQGPLGVYKLSEPFVSPSGGPRTKISTALHRSRVSREAFLQSIWEALR